MGGPKNSRRAGFTVLEVLLAAAIGVVILGGAYMVYELGQSTVQRDERKVNLQQNVRSALDLLMWQIRHAGYLNRGTVPNRIAIGTDTLLVLRGDVQLNGTPGITDTLFGLQAPGTGLCPAPSVGPGASCLVTGSNVYAVPGAQVLTAFNVSAIRFAYFDENDVALATPLDGVGPGAFPNGAAAASPLAGPTTDRDAVRLIRITLTAADAHVSAGPGIGSAPEEMLLTADVRIRNVN